jgi:hypothetical protein
MRFAESAACRDYFESRFAVPDSGLSRMELYF